jgi:transcriptional regulator with XRE-family HTH domain
VYASRPSRAARPTPLARLIYERRLLLGLRLADVAAACGVTEVKVWAWETGRQWPRELVAAGSLADALGLTVDQVWRAVAEEIAAEQLAEAGAWPAAEEKTG